MLSENLIQEAERQAQSAFSAIERVCQENSEKVLSAFLAETVQAADLLGTTGYGYDDIGRDKIDRVFARVLGTEDALVRHNFVNGTHAISTALFALLRPGDRILSLTGAPYDTLRGIMYGETPSGLKAWGIHYSQLDHPDIALIKSACAGVKAVFIQRSRGYTLREPLTVAEINGIYAAVKSVNPEAAVIVDNCYGELCERDEPEADLLCGSLIKNLGGGIAQTGGYIAGRSDLINLCAERLTVAGQGREVGCSLDQNRGILLGLYHAPQAVANALKASVFACALFKQLGYETYPAANDPRTDIIAAIKLGDKNKLIAFCEAIQAHSPVDSSAKPTPWHMPGYDCEVIMAAGAFTGGASIELSADAPLREPFAVWLQGGLNYYMAKRAIIAAAEAVGAVRG
jgi:cystathionine beta-lyase family protein involved in aluminum resistance